MNKILLLLIVITCVSCGRSSDVEMEEESKFWSPSKNYYVSASINDNPDEKYLCVRIHLFSEAGLELSHLQTNASNQMKWALGWMEREDVVVLYSSDIGTYAYSIDSANQLIEAEVNDLIERGHVLYQQKYRD